MQRLEKYIYNLVKNNSAIKDFLVKVYQFVFCFFGLIKGKIVTEYDYTEIRNSFFGFHDRASMNKEGQVLSHIAESKFVNGAGHASITVSDIHSGETHVVASTKCCNFQQGSLLTWFSDTQIIYNDVNEQGPITIIKDLNSDAIQTLPFHFFSLAPNSKFVSSVNFYRFGQGLNGYGYDINYPSQYIEDGESHFSTAKISDFVIFDIEESETVYRLSIQEAKKQSVGLIDDGYFYFSHSCFSPSSNKIYFLLRSSNSFYNSSQLFSYDLVEKQLIALPSGGMVSHLSWLSDSTIIAFCNTKNDKSFAYYVFDLTTGSVESAGILGLDKDGHPHARSADIFYTDTYPDKERRQYLFCVNLPQNSVQTILSVYSPLSFRGVGRVDFHPRLSLCENYLTIDTPHNSDRTQLILQLKK
ncbi:MAG: hypothetical protein GQ532_05140 [Methylomarinum sp.]|nr:hypothetical protein [Methylomarinum sp.]